MEAVAAAGEKGLLDIVAATHVGNTMSSSRLSRTGSLRRGTRTQRLYTAMVYTPMLVLLAYLRANGFMTFIVSGGGVEFMRPWVERAYGIPPSRWLGVAPR